MDPMVQMSGVATNLRFKHGGGRAARTSKKGIPVCQFSGPRAIHEDGNGDRGGLQHDDPLDTDNEHDTG